MLNQGQTKHLEIEHNIHIDIESMQYTTGERDDDYGWAPIPQEWINKLNEETS